VLVVDCYLCFIIGDQVLGISFLYYWSLSVRYRVIVFLCTDYYLLLLYVIC